MKRFTVEGKHAWKVLGGTSRTQAAEMAIQPGHSEGGPDNRHLKSDQWLLVISGQGTARVGRRRVSLQPGILLLIEQAEPHQIYATGRTPLRTVNVYGPPAY